MRTRDALTAGAGAVCLVLLLSAAPAAAGPCEAEIAELEQKLANPTGKSTGALSGSRPGAIEGQAPQPQADAPPVGAGGAGGKEMGTFAGTDPNAREQPVDPAAGRATSPQDVRLQQQGQPTTAQGGDPQAAGGRYQEARAALDKARDLDGRNDSACQSAVNEAEQLFRQGA